MRVARVAWDDDVPTYVELRGEMAWPTEAPPWSPDAPALRAPRSLEGGRLLVPTEPTKILAVGRNYAAHAAELGHEVPREPLWFLKPPSALVATGAPIVGPAASERVDFEGEIAAIIGRRASHVSEAGALDHVFGYTCFNDVTARDLQRRDGQFTRGKGFDSFAPCGPWIETALDLERAELVTRVDGAVRQRGRTQQMVFSVAALVSRASAVMTLEPGDLLVTGTPEGVGPLEPGQVVEVEVSGIGVLRNPFRRAQR